MTNAIKMPRDHAGRCQLTRQDITLNDRYDLIKKQVLLKETQALVRVILLQNALDVALGLDTTGIVTSAGLQKNALDFLATPLKVNWGRI